MAGWNLNWINGELHDWPGVVWQFMAAISERCEIRFGQTLKISQVSHIAGTDSMPLIKSDLASWDVQFASDYTNQQQVRNNTVNWNWIQEITETIANGTVATGWVDPPEIPVIDGTTSMYILSVTGSDNDTTVTGHYYVDAYKWRNFWKLVGGVPRYGWGQWRRTTVHPTDPAFGGFGYGRMQKGDIIGYWIFEDLKKALEAMVWRTKTVSFTIPITGPNYEELLQSPIHETLPQAITYALSNSVVGSGDFIGPVGWTELGTETRANAVPPWPGGGYTAGFSTIEMDTHVDDTTSPYKHSLSVYSWAVRPHWFIDEFLLEGLWNAYGVDVTEKKWNKFFTVAAAYNTHYHSDGAIGRKVAPDSNDWSPIDEDTGFDIMGFWIDVKRAVAKYNVTDGFVYT